MSGISASYTPRFLPARLPRVCVAIAASNPLDMVEKADAVVRDNPFIEFRLDYLSKPGLALPKLKKFAEFHPHVVSIATCRRVASGGKFRGSIASQLQILAKAADAGSQLIDLEVQSAQRVKPE